MKAKVRKIRFGIRFKFSIIMIAGVVLTSALITMAVFNQQDQGINDAVVKWGSSLLLGPRENTRKLLEAEHLLSVTRGNQPAHNKRVLLMKQAADANREIREYFASIVRKEPGIDIAFLIRSDWNDVKIDWNRPDQAFFRYHSRNTGALFQYKSGRYDDNLKPHVYRHFMEAIRLEPKISVMTIRYRGQDKEKQYIILSMPIFRNDEAIYREYLAVKSRPLYSRKDMEKRNADVRRLMAQFLDRVMNNASNFDFDLSVSGDRERKIVFSLLARDYRIVQLNFRDRIELYKEYNGLIAEQARAGRIALSSAENIMRQLGKKYGIRAATGNNPYGREAENPWREAYGDFKRYGIPVYARQAPDELALISYRMDLSGMHGFFLERNEFFSVVETGRREIIDLIVSILLRCIIIALFFPTFLIRSIQNLADAALEIGRGKLDTVISIKGSDEIGRLADILNVMTRNLRKARDEIADKQRMEDELETAQKIQEALLPKELPSIKGFEFGAYYSAQSEAGGDYYDFIRLDDDTLGIAGADVSGHGVGSGLVMAMTRTLLHVYCRSSSDIRTLMASINSYLNENTEDNYFVTMFYGVLDLRTLEMRFASAGHLPGIVLRKDGMEELTARGIVLGAFDNDVFNGITHTKKAAFKKGDYLILYTDGIIEAMDGSRNEYGMDRFRGALVSRYGKPPKEMIDAVIADMNSFIKKTPQHDDITIVVVRIL